MQTLANVMPHYRTHTLSPHQRSQEGFSLSCLVLGQQHAEALAVAAVCIRTGGHFALRDASDACKLFITQHERSLQKWECWTIDNFDAIKRLFPKACVPLALSSLPSTTPIMLGDCVGGPDKSSSCMRAPAGSCLRRLAGLRSTLCCVHPRWGRCALCGWGSANALIVSISTKCTGSVAVAAAAHSCKRSQAQRAPSEPQASANRSVHTLRARSRRHPLPQPLAYLRLEANVAFLLLRPTPAPAT